MGVLKFSKNMSFLFLFFSVLIMFFFVVYHPFILSIFLLISSVAMISFFLSFVESWINLVLALIYLGGILVVFIYVSSVLPNVSFFMYFLEFGFIFCLGAFIFVCLEENIFLKNILFQAYSNFFLLFLLKNWVLVLLFLFFLVLILISSMEFSWKKCSPLRSI